jgi:hypothetical protein
MIFLTYLGDINMYGTYNLLATIASSLCAVMLVQLWWITPFSFREKFYYTGLTIASLMFIWLIAFLPKGMIPTWAVVLFAVLTSSLIVACFLFFAGTAKYEKERIMRAALDASGVDYITEDLNFMRQFDRTLGKKVKPKKFKKTERRLFRKFWCNENIV